MIALISLKNSPGILTPLLFFWNFKLLFNVNSHSANTSYTNAQHDQTHSYAVGRENTLRNGLLVFSNNPTGCHKIHLLSDDRTFEEDESKFNYFYRQIFSGFYRESVMFIETIRSAGKSLYMEWWRLVFAQHLQCSQFIVTQPQTVIKYLIIEPERNHNVLPAIDR